MEINKEEASVNSNLNKSNQFDVIVVGSGMSGGWAAKEFSEKGFKTLVLERGRDLKHGDYPTAHMEPWDDKFRMQRDPKHRKENPIMYRAGVAGPVTNHYLVEDHVQPYIEKKPFDWVRAYQTGGKSLLWARQVQRWSDLDFTANAKDGHGVDWPIRYKDLAPWYSYVEKFIGVQGNKDGLGQIPDGEFLPPMEMNCLESFMKERVESKFPNRNVIIARSANLTQPHNGRGKCMNRSRCSRGCPYGAYFSAVSSTLPAAYETGNMTLRPHSIVQSVIYDDKKGKAIGVRVIDAETKELVEYYSKVIFLNAGTLNSTAILLNSKSDRFPEGLGNEHDVLGRYLMDHDYRGRIGGTHDGFKDKYYFGKKPTGCYIPRFRNYKNDQQKNFLRGYALGFGCARGGGELEESELPIGADFKENIFELGPWFGGIHIMGEHLPYHDNRVTLSKDKTDEWGMPLLEIDCEYKENEDKILEDGLNAAAEMLKAAGFKNIDKHIIKHWNPGLSIHEMGTARMGKDPKTSILNKYNQIHSVKNVFVTDGACMASSACQNPSLTYMAITARAANYAIDELKKGNL